MGFGGMYISHLYLDFDLELEIYVSPMWVMPPHLPLSFWDDSSLRAIGDKVNQFIDHVEPKGYLYYCARSCV